jgi:hypothetical protein
VYDWIDDAHGNSSPEGPRESDWLTDQSYMDANKEPIVVMSCINSGGFVKRDNHKSSLLLYSFVTFSLFRFLTHLFPHSVTGGKGEFTQWVHCEFFVSPKTIRPVVTQQVRGEFF